MSDVKLELLHDFSLWADALEHIAKKNQDNPEIIAELDILSNKSVILSIIKEIENGTYKIEVPTVVKKKKDDGSFREIYVNTLKDRVVLRVINSIYQKLYSNKIHRLCVSYKKGISVGKVITRLSNILAYENSKGNRLVGYKLDISKFFDSVSRCVLLSALESLSTDSAVDRLILEYYTDDRVFLKEEGVLENRYKGLAQGCALSSFLCNYILRDLDEYFSDSLIYYRYSDDIVIFDGERNVISELEEKLSDYGLSLNRKKIEEIYSDEWFTFLGFSVKGSIISISKNSLKKFQTEIKTRFTSCKTYYGFIRSVYSYLYSNDVYTCRGWFGIKAGTVTSVSDIKCLDMWVQDMFLAFKYKKKRIGNLGYNPHKDGVISRGKGRNVRKNREKGQEEEFISMLELFFLYKIHKNLYLNKLITEGVI